VDITLNILLPARMSEFEPRTFTGHLKIKDDVQRIHKIITAVEIHAHPRCFLRIEKGMYVWCNIEARSCNLCCSGKAISITYYEYVFVALVIQGAMRMCRIFICDMSGCTIFFHITVESRFTTGLLSRIFGCKSNRRKTSTI
jgi:uncharacterized Zn-finger protein